MEFLKERIWTRGYVLDKVPHGCNFNFLKKADAVALEGPEKLFGIE